MFRAIEQQAPVAGEIELLDGTFIRFGPDEGDILNVPTSVSFDTEMPGGFGPADITFSRPSQFDPIRAKLFASMRLYDLRSAQTLYEGRVTGVPIDSESLTLQCEGWIKALEDDQTARFLGIDRSFENWEGPSVQYQLNDLAANKQAEGASVEVDPSTGEAALATSYGEDWTATSLPDSSGFYDAHGLDIGSVDYAFKADRAFASLLRFWQVATGDTAESFLNATGNLNAGSTMSGSGTLTGGVGHKFAEVVFLWNGIAAPGTPDGNRQNTIFWTLLTPIGNHGLPLQGTVAAPNTGRGLLVSDMVSYLASSFAPILNQSTGPNGSISATSFSVPHAVWLDDTTAREMIDALVLFGGSDLYPLDLYVYDNRTLYLQGPSQHGTTWHVRRDDAVQESSEGPDSSRRINGVKVAYDDGTGTRLSVGPPGSTSTLETTDLQDTSPDNPANQDGQRHWELFDAGVMTQEGASLVGQMILASRNLEQWRGSITMAGEVQNDAGAWFPVAAVRAGDWIVVDDDADTSPRRVVQTTYSDQTLNASVGSSPDHLDTLLARANVVLTGRL